MAGMKITLDAALRARDVSRPTPGQEALAEQALPERLASRRAAGAAGRGRYRVRRDRAARPGP
jgi:hypothetical protein